MLTIRRTLEFIEWLNDLKDVKGKSKIAARLARVQNGLLGDVKYFRGIGELKIDFGPGYRVYFMMRGKEVVLLLCGGDKAHQNSDIEYALTLAEREKRNDT